MSVLIVTSAEAQCKQRPSYLTICISVLKMVSSQNITKRWPANHRMKARREESDKKITKANNIGIPPIIAKVRRAPDFPENMHSHRCDVVLFKSTTRPSKID